MNGQMVSHIKFPVKRILSIWSNPPWCTVWSVGIWYVEKTMSKRRKRLSVSFFWGYKKARSACVYDTAKSDLHYLWFCCYTSKRENSPKPWKELGNHPVCDEPSLSALSLDGFDSQGAISPCKSLTFQTVRSTPFVYLQPPISNKPWPLPLSLWITTSPLLPGSCQRADLLRRIGTAAQIKIAVHMVTKRFIYGEIHVNKRTHP